jgi:dipeptidase
MEIRNDVAKELACVEWICFGSNPFNAFVPLYANVKKVPEYFNNTTLDVNTNNFYWASRLLGVMADAHFQSTAILIERYQNAVANKSREILNRYDAEGKGDLLEQANEELASMAKVETQKALNQVLFVSSCGMKNGFNRSDN